MSTVGYQGSSATGIGRLQTPELLSRMCLRGSRYPGATRMLYAEARDPIPEGTGSVATWKADSAKWPYEAARGLAQCNGC